MCCCTAVDPRPDPSGFSDQGTCVISLQGLNLDLTADLQPPKELHVEVRVLNDCGEIMTDHVRIFMEVQCAPFWLAHVDLQCFARLRLFMGGSVTNGLKRLSQP